MMIENANEYESQLSLVKALSLSNNEEVCGYYQRFKDKHFVYWSDDNSAGIFDINPNTVCRNSGIFDRKGNFIYEFDLLKVTGFGKKEHYAFLEWSVFYRCWQLKSSLAYASSADVRSQTLEVVGNILLNESDFEKIIKQDEAEEKRETFIDNSDCRPKHKRLEQKW